MILQLKPHVRRVLIHCRCLAMSGQFNDAISRLDEEIALLNSEADILDQVSLLMLKAEILYLHCQDNDALELFRINIDPKLNLLSQEMTIVVGHNRNDIARTILHVDSSREFYQLYDQVQLTGVKLWNPKAMVYAYEDAARGEHYDALPAFWRELVETYNQGCWRYFLHAAERMVRECLQLGWLDLAAYYTVISRDDKLAELVCEHLLARRESNLIRLTVQRFLNNANLKRHARVACSLLAGISDAIPDDQMDTVLRWLLPKASLTPTTNSELRFVTVVWEALQNLAPRLSCDQARDVVRIATEHTLWEQPNHLRDNIVKTVNQCVAALPIEQLQQLAQQSIPLATEYKHDIDYQYVISLLCHIANRAGDTVKAQIGNALYPSERVENYILMKVAPTFGRQLAGEEEAGRFAESIAQDVKKLVQHLGPEDKGERVSGSYGSVSVQGGGEATIVSIYSFTGLDAVINQRKLLPLNSLQTLVNALLDMIKEPENIWGNKVGLIYSIFNLADCFISELANLVFETLAPIASGNIAKPQIMGGIGDADNPLNSFKVNVGTPAQVCGAAMNALARIEAELPGAYGSKLDSIIEQASTNTDTEIRYSAFTAARLIPTVSQSMLMALLLGTRDSDPNVAQAAYAALATKKDLPLNESLWYQLVYSLTLACGSPSRSVRRAAAFTITNLRTQYPDYDIRSKMMALEESLSQDICHSVRSALADKKNNQMRIVSTSS